MTVSIRDNKTLLMLWSGFGEKNNKLITCGSSENKQQVFPINSYEFVFTKLSLANTVLYLSVICINIKSAS